MEDEGWVRPTPKMDQKPFGLDRLTMETTLDHAQPDCITTLFMVPEILVTSKILSLLFIIVFIFIERLLIDTTDLSPDR